VSNRLHVDTFGSGDRLVLVHGFTQTGRSWSKIVAGLAHDYEVVLVDLPGHGDSSELGGDLVDTAELLGAVGGRATYVGYSMGGRVCLHLALAHPELVERLVVLGATGGLDSEAERAERRHADEQLAQDIEALGVERFLERWLANPLFARLPDDPEALAERHRNTAAGLASSLRATGTGTQQPLWSRLDSLQMPVLAMAGEYDAKFRALADRLVDSIGPNASVSVVADAGHAAHLEQPDAFVTNLRTFLEAAPVAPH
jgi:2-succinyl-6-hydroxy-2,4-cyclohexadiene-1-carboxylate synthase